MEFRKLRRKLEISQSTTPYACCLSWCEPQFEPETFVIEPRTKALANCFEEEERKNHFGKFHRSVEVCNPCCFQAQSSFQAAPGGGVHVKLRSFFGDQYFQIYIFA